LRLFKLLAFSLLPSKLTAWDIVMTFGDTKPYFVKQNAKAEAATKSPWWLKTSALTIASTSWTHDEKDLKSLAIIRLTLQEIRKEME